MMTMMMMMTGSWSGGFHIARQPPTAANLNIQSSISLSIDIVDILLKFEYPIFAVYIEDIHHNEINSISDLFFRSL